MATASMAPARTRTRIDPVTARVIAGALESIAIEMGHKLTRMSYSSIIRESEDFGCALLDTQGRQLCESTFSTPLQLGPIPGYARGIFRLFKERGARFVELVERFGVDRVMAASEDLMDYSERMLRQEIAKLPDGTYHAEGFIDGFPDLDDPAYKDLRIAVALTISGSDITVDLTGTAPQIDRPLNMPFEGTVDIAIYLTIRSVLLDTATHEFVPQNSGLTRPISIVAPPGSLCNPIFPAPTIARFCPGNIVADTVMRALAQVAPDRVAAGIGNLEVAAYSGVVGSQYWVYMDIREGDN